MSLMKLLLLLLPFCLSLFFSVANFAQAAPFKTILFVHGAMGGGWDYKHLEIALEQKGHKVYRITLTGLGERAHLLSASINLDTHILDVVNTIKYEGLTEVILVAHSYGGMVITGVADRMQAKIKHLVYLDALLPIDGENVFDMLPLGDSEMMRNLAQAKGNNIAIPPFWDNWKSTNDVPHPLATFTQAISLKNKAGTSVPGTYVLTIDKDQQTDETFAVSAQRAKHRGWKTLVWRTDHNVHHSMSNEVIELLIAL